MTVQQQQQTSRSETGCLHKVKAVLCCCCVSRKPAAAQAQVSSNTRARTLQEPSRPRPQPRPQKKRTESFQQRVVTLLRRSKMEPPPPPPSAAAVGAPAAAAVVAAAPTPAPAVVATPASEVAGIPPQRSSYDKFRNILRRKQKNNSDYATTSDIEAANRESENSKMSSAVERMFSFLTSLSLRRSRNEAGEGSAHASASASASSTLAHAQTSTGVSSQKKVMVTDGKTSDPTYYSQVAQEPVYMNGVIPDRKRQNVALKASVAAVQPDNTGNTMQSLSNAVIEKNEQEDVEGNYDIVRDVSDASSGSSAMCSLASSSSGRDREEPRTSVALPENLPDEPAVRTSYV